MKSYTLFPPNELSSPDELAAGWAIRCLFCRRVSHHPRDVEEKYCGHCHRFHSEEEFETLVNLESGELVLVPLRGIEELGEKAPWVQASEMTDDQWIKAMEVVR